ncbi:hypothetical protein KKD19_01925 [Patescibacteria group bacterium]|nr:hypothetical protein [Patescibacteria group bacterium]MBU4511984.1 hypothetical protein [Patescibacteria group bacterium]MCG2693388.1 hypothetical protein [Candidatus Parcubacteria bacterium]
MTFNYKKFFILLGFILIVLALGYGIYYAFFRKPVPGPLVNVNEEYPGMLPNIGPYVNQPPYVEVNEGLPPVTEVPIKEEEPSEIAQGGLTEVKEVTAVRAEGAMAQADGTIAYYNRDESKFYRIGPDGEPMPLTDKLFHQVSKVNWAPNASRAVLEYPDGSKIMYDFDNEKQYTLPKQWEDFSFAPSSDEIVFKHLAQDKENRWLAVAKADGSGAEAIEPLGENGDKVQVTWSPTGQVVATFWESMDAERQEIFLIGLHGENFKSMITHGRGFESQWTPQGDKLVYSVYNSEAGFRPTLWVADAQGDSIGMNRKYLGVDTWIDKCTIGRDNQTAYCAVPSYLPEGAGLYPDLANDIPDYFYKVNLKTGTKSLLAQPNGDYTAESVFLSPDEGYLYFTDINTGALSKIRLK